MADSLSQFCSIQYSLQFSNFILELEQQFNIEHTLFRYWLFLDNDNGYENIGYNPIEQNNNTQQQLSTTLTSPLSAFVWNFAVTFFY